MNDEQTGAADEAFSKTNRHFSMLSQGCRWRHRGAAWAWAFLLFLTVMAGQAQLVFTTNNSTITITAYTGSGGAVVIPSMTNGYPVVSIGNSAFSITGANVTSVTTPSSVVNIGSAAFFDCFNLTNVSISASVTNIGALAFYYCTALPIVTIPASVTNIGDQAFTDCYNLKSALFQGNPPPDDGTVFSGDTGITTVYYLPTAKGWGSTFGGVSTFLDTATPVITLIGAANTNDCAGSYVDPGAIASDPYIGSLAVTTVYPDPDPQYTNFTLLVTFDGVGGAISNQNPYASLVQGTDGNLYGTTYYGGEYDYGTIFKMTPSGALTTLVQFSGVAGPAPGAYPYLGALVQGTNGNFYGTTYSGGASNFGTVFEVTPAGAFTSLVAFTSMNGSNPNGGLVLGTNGYLYGTSFGGTDGDGTVFKMTHAGVLTTLVSFTGSGGSAPGIDPEATLVLGTNGNLYGTTVGGGTYGDGTVFEMTYAGAVTSLASFTGFSGPNYGEGPFGGMVEGTDGNFYGTTYYGGTYNDGTVFKITPSGAFTTVAFLDDGFEPIGTLIQGTDGNLYGTTKYGGANDSGSVFNMTLSGTLTTVISFTGTGGAEPGTAAWGGLVQGKDGNFYGTTEAGGANNYGTVFKISPTIPTNVSALGANVITYIATGPGGVSATNTRTVNLLVATPIISLNGAALSNFQCGASFADPGATANDACGNSLTVTTSGSVNPGVLGAITLSYVANDPSGNSATNTRTINVVDATPPVITLIGAAATNVQCASSFADPGATANDTCAGSVTVTASGSVNTNVVAAYTLSYVAADPSGNSATNTRVVTVIDTISPVITLIGPATTNIQCTTAFTDPGAIANDTCAGALTVTASGSVNTSVVATYTLNYAATDPSGNSAAGTRLVKVIDTTPPVITLDGSNLVVLTVDTAFSDPGATANDACAGAVAVTTFDSVNTNVIGTYTVRYVASDPSANSATNTRLVEVVAPPTPPSLTIAWANKTSATTNATGNFAPSSSPGVGTAPDSVVVMTNFNGQGTQALISGNYTTKTLTVLTNNGAGIFGSNATYSTPAGPVCLAVADVNGDGKPDLIYSSSDNENLTVLTNNGSGVFGSNAVYSVPGQPYNFAAADVNGDGKVDLVVADYNAYEVMVLTNNGAGTFVSSGTFSCGSQYPRWIAVADYNGDGRPDIAVADYYSSHSLAILTNSGNGTFISASSVVVGGYAFGLATADVNGDGKPDLISSAGSGGNVLSVCTNNGNGTFTSVVNYTVGPSPSCVVAADVNGDGKPDLICVNNDNSLTVLTNSGSGTFVLDETIPAVGTGASFVAVADVNGDGTPDLITANAGTNSLTVLTNAASILTTSFRGAVISWPSPSTGFVLQQMSTLGTTNWTNSTLSVNDNGTTRSVSNSLTTNNLFFRLLNP